MKKPKLKSMTAFGRATFSSSAGTFEIEMVGGNRRHLECVFHLPRAFSRFEAKLREEIGALVGRGQVVCSLNFRLNEKKELHLRPNLPLAAALKKGYDEVGKKLGISDKVTFSLLAREQDLFISYETKEEEKEKELGLQKALKLALDEFLTARIREGEILGNDLSKRVKLLQKVIAKIEKGSNAAAPKYREKLLTRLELHLPELVIDDRILKEVALFAERVDITEEIVRFKSHLAAFVETLFIPFKEANETKGKRLDFILQELFREINTIGSKASDQEIAGEVIYVKCELERMREQVQNIE